MRLIKCYVDNFGKLEHFQYDFVQGINVIKEDNGWGKTTLATFIKAMLYGLPVTKSPELDRNERKKYNPWNGGNFGGWLDFALGDKEYRVTRYFGPKEADDTFELTNLKTNKSSSDYTSDLGREIFGLDADGFERSCFIPQKVLNDDTNATLVSKLNNLINGTNDKESCATAVDRLKEASSSLPSMMLEDTCASEVIVNGINGFALPNNPTAWKNKLIEVLNDKNKLQDIRDIAKKTVYVSWKTIVDQLYDFYKQAISNKQNMTINSQNDVTSNKTKRTKKLKSNKPKSKSLK